MNLSDLLNIAARYEQALHEHKTIDHTTPPDIDIMAIDLGQ